MSHDVMRLRTKLTNTLSMYFKNHFLSWKESVPGQGRINLENVRGSGVIELTASEIPADPKAPVRRVRINLTLEAAEELAKFIKGAT